MSSDLLHKILQKKELQQVSKEVAKQELQKVLAQYAKELGKKEQQEIVKEVRRRLRRKVGMFSSASSQISSTERKAQLKALYTQLQEKINPKIIVDLGCGEHPLHIPASFMQDKTYYAYDINEEQIKQLTAHFKKQRYPAQAEVRDITKPIEDLPSADCALLFKVLDIIDNRKHSNAERLIRALLQKYPTLVISFPTITISGKPMRFKRRRWLELTLKRLHTSFTFFWLGSEIFYITSKDK